MKVEDNNGMKVSFSLERCSTIVLVGASSLKAMTKYDLGSPFSVSIPGLRKKHENQDGLF